MRREYVTFDRLLLAAHGRLRLPRNGSRGEANIDKFLAQARDAASRMSLDEFVDELALVRERIRASRMRRPRIPPNAVKVMTVHSAKGLEFPVVFVAAMHKGDRDQSAGGRVLAALRAGRALAQSGDRQG